MPENINNESILQTIKKMLGLAPGDQSFDMDVIISINSAFSILHQLGASPPNGFYIESATDLWSDFLLDVKNAQFVKTYIYKRVKLDFDPPPTSFHLTSLENQVKELDFRLSIMEFEFNPDAEERITNGNAFMWTVSDSGDFPEEAKEGDLGIDPVSGNLWRNTNG